MSKNKPTKLQSIDRRMKFKICWATTAVVVMVALVVGVCYALADYYINLDTDEVVPETTTEFVFESTSPECLFDGEIAGSDPTDHFESSENDGLYVPFSHATNTKQETADAINDENVLMIEGDITLRYFGTSQETTEPIMAHPPELNSDNTLEEWLKNILASEKGPKLDIKVEEVIPYALQELERRFCEADQPIWINADVAKGPNTISQPINAATLIDNVNQYFPDLTLSLGWTTGYRPIGENDVYSWDSMDYMYNITQTTSQQVTFPVRAILARDSWEKFLWLVDQDENRFSLTIWSPSTDPVRLEDKLFIRDNFDPARLYYDCTGTFADDIVEEINDRTLPKLFYTGGNVLDYYEFKDRNAMRITWNHAVNSIEKLNNAINDDSVLMLEADVRSYGEGTTSTNRSVPVMSHDPGPSTLNAITFEDWLKEVIVNSTKGIKLDFKSLPAIKPALEIMNQMKDDIHIPVWINADVIRGPNVVGTPVNVQEFLKVVNEVFPHATLSPGWTTAYNPAPNADSNKYTQEMMEEMYDAIKTTRQGITYPVRASLTQPSIPELQWLLNKSDRYTLTVWHSGSEKVTTEELLEIHNSFPIHKVYYDLPDEMMKSFLDAVQNQ